MKKLFKVVTVNLLIFSWSTIGAAAFQAQKLACAKAWGKKKSWFNEQHKTNQP